MNNALNNLRAWWIFMAMIITSSVAAMSAVPSAPEDLEAANNGNNLSYWTFLKWEMPNNSPTFNRFDFYVAEGFTSSLAEFTLKDTLSYLQDSIPQDSSGHYFHALGEFPKGDYTAYVTAYNADGESAPSNLLEFTILGSKVDSRIYFTNDYPENLKLTKNTAWTYDIDAECKEDITIKYEIADAPQGMVIDENTGVISWTPTEGGSYQFLIYAYEDGNEDNKAPFWMDVYVYNCETPPVVRGTVENKDGEPIKQGKVYLYTAMVDSTKGPRQFWGGIENGEFSFEADAGQYEVVVVANGYKPIYLPKDGNTEYIPLECGVSVTFAFELTKNDWNKDYIRFTAYPQYSDKKASIGEEWSFDFEAEAKDDDAEVRFRLENEPQGMTVDALTGVVTWTPTESGYHSFNIVAFDANDNAVEARMSTYIDVMTCLEPIKVTGTVYYEPENPGDELVPVRDGAFAVLISTEEIDSTNQGKHNEYKAPIIDGVYSIDADAGTYYLWFGGRGEFVDEYWENSLYMSDATQITLECGNNYTFNPLVEEYIFPTTYQVSGQVRDEDTGEGIPYAFVEVIGTEDSNYRVFTIAATDDEGYYEINLYENYEYIFRASADAFGNIPPMGDSSEYIRYIPEYYEDVTDIMEATSFVVTENLVDIDFDLQKAASYDNKLVGAVLNNDSTGYVPAWVVAFLVETDPNNKEHLNWGLTTKTLANSGVYSFENLFPGDYILLAFPEDMEYAPGYYLQGDLATLNWKEATRITVNATDAYYGNNIRLPKMKDIIGSGIISGRIGKKGKDGGIVKGQGEPIPGALVYTVDQYSNIVKFERTNQIGEFHIDELATGKYNVIIDKVGYNQLSMWADITDENSEIDIDSMTMNEAPTSAEDKIFAEISLYPNPVVTQLTVNLGTLTSDANICLVDLTGVTLYKGTVSSNENHKIDVEGITSGMYYLKVTIEEEVTVLPVSITK